jgi:FeS assembly SUF system protein
MSEEATKPERTHLPILPTGRVEQLKNDAAAPAQPPAAPGAGASEALASANSAPAQSPTIEDKLLEGKVIAALCTVYDPEIPVNIYELGLIYKIAIDAERNVTVTMTLTAPACPVAGTLPGEVEQRVEAVGGVKSATVELVWDPPWSRDRMSESALLALGMM